VTDILAKSLGSRTSINVIRAVFNGIDQILDARSVAHHRGKALKDMWG
jgi:small subunit ribosomal protein S5